MANKDNIFLLSKYQMMVLYYKSKEGATHEQIAEILGRDVNTIQYHMTKIYKVLEISRPGKSKEEMDSELKNEICPIIRQMFKSSEDVKTWAPSKKRSHAPVPSEPVPPFPLPPSLERVLSQNERRPSPPEIIQSPPPGRPRRNRWLVVALIGISFVLIGGWRLITLVNTPPLRPADTATQSSATQPAFVAEIASLSTVQPTATETLMPLPTATAANTPTPTVIATQVSPKDGMILVNIPAGEFKMGSSRADDPQTLDEEIPEHIVYLDSYWLDQAEVSNAQYARCVADVRACTPPGDFGSLSRSSYYDNPLYADYPVVFVSWSQASTYCTWAGRRLPTEAEWEKAARGSDGLIFPWGNSFDGTKANYCDINCINGWKDSQFDDGFIDTSPVGDYPSGASIYNVLDMSGNVYEWVADWYGPYNRLNQVNPLGPPTGAEHIIRGGSWGDDSAHIRTAVRSHSNVPESSNFIGFRCAQ